MEDSTENKVEVQDMGGNVNGRRLNKFCRRTHYLLNVVITVLLLFNLQLTTLFIMPNQTQMINYQGHHISRRDVNDTIFPETTEAPKKSMYTFVTLLCDDKLLDATSVLVYSLINYAKTKYPVTVVTLPEVSEGARLQLRTLGAQIVDIAMLEYPFKTTQARLEQNKPCRYSKLQLWSMIQYDKIVYMDSDMLALQNIDSLFTEYDEFSAVADSYPGIFNSGIFVLKPSSVTYEKLLSTYKTVDSYNVGDQGYLNWYFGAEWKANTSRHLPLVYNVLIKYKGSVIWPTIQDDIKVLHFTAETKPWNIHFSQHIDWKQNSDPVLYYKWIYTRRQVDKIMNKDSKLNPMNNVIHEKCFAETDLLNKNKNNLDKRFPIENKFSVVLSTFNRFELAMKLIHHYSKSKFVDHIFLVWHDPKKEPPNVLKFLAEGKKNPPVTILRQTTDSLNNKFNPIPQLRTRGVLIVDDDVIVDIRDIDYTFSIWRTNTYSIVGNFPRFHSYNATDNPMYRYHVSEPNVPRTSRRYSIILTKFMFIRSEYHFWYTCLLPEQIHGYIDEHMNCEDIAMQMLATGMSNAPPIAVQVMKPIDDYGTEKGISASSSHLGTRDECLCYFHKVFGKQEVLIYNQAVLSRFEKIPFVKKSLQNQSTST